jgi:hypothetical protein
MKTDYNRFILKGIKYVMFKEEIERQFHRMETAQRKAAINIMV